MKKVRIGYKVRTLHLKCKLASCNKPFTVKVIGAGSPPLYCCFEHKKIFQKAMAKYRYEKFIFVHQGEITKKNFLRNKRREKYKKYLKKGGVDINNFRTQYTDEQYDAELKECCRYPSSPNGLILKKGEGCFSVSNNKVAKSLNYN